MEIRLKETGTVITESEFRALHPNTGFPSQLTEQIINDFGGDVVFEGPQATGGNHYQYSQRQGIELVDGKWFTKYVLGPIFTDNEEATAAEQEAAYKAQKDAEQAKNVREQRNKLLSESDWTQLADAPVDAVIWSNYRQELRDVTKQDGFPFSVVWPESPN